MSARSFLIAASLFCGIVAPLCAQVIPPDESLTDGPATDMVDSAGVISPAINRETINAASPSTLLRDSTDDEAGRRRWFAKRQRDSSYVDTAGIKFFKKVFSPVFPNPERAGAMSFLLPGAGQIYNRRFSYIKVPVIYAGLVGLIYSGENNRHLRDRFKVALQARLLDKPHEFSNTRFDNPQALRTRRDQYDKNYQLSYIGVGILHLVQVLEAYTTAHLLNFDMDENLSIGPRIHPPAGMGFGESYALGLDPTDNRPRISFGISYVFGPR